MKAWTRARNAAERCGRCAQPIAAGAPLLVFTGPGWRAVRCARFAGEPVGRLVDLAQPEPEAVNFGARVAAILERVRSERDWKHSQAGDQA
jgi:hypothetical protein